MENNNLKIYVDKFFDELVLNEDLSGHNFKDILKANIDVFLEYKSLYNAFNVYETFLNIYQINGEYRSQEKNIRILNETNIPLDCVKIMYKYEKISKQRHYDSLIHSINIFIFGLAVYTQNTNYREIFKDYVISSHYEEYYRLNNELSNEEFLYRWGIASLFQNIAINVERLGKSLIKLINEEMITTFNSHGESIKINLLNLQKLDSIEKIDDKFGDKYKKIFRDAKFLDLYKPTDILVHKVSLDFGLDKRQENHLKNTINNLLIDCPCMENNFTDYATVSSIIILVIFGYLIQKYDQNTDYFFYPILDSATAVLLKNVFRNVLQHQRLDYNIKKLEPKQNPLAFLLVLCNELMVHINPINEVKKRESIVDLNLEMDDNLIDISYLLKKGALIIDSNLLEKYLNDILEIRGVFPRGLNIKSYVESYDDLISEKQLSELTSKYLPLELLYKLAKGIHDQYIKVVTETYNEAIKNDEMTDNIQESYDNILEFNELSLDLKITNVRLARLIPNELNLIGYELAYQSDERTAIKEFSEEEISKVAILKHEEWLKEKKETGWKYGIVKDDEKCTHPFIVEWEDLDKDRQQSNMDTVKAIPEILDTIGLKIVETKIRLLAREMHNFWVNYDENNSYDKLPADKKYYNYKHMKWMINNLKSYGYHIVDIRDENKEIKSLEEYEIEYLSKKEHDEWYKTKISLGWKYGDKKDEKLKTNPAMLPWDELEPSYRDANRYTYRNLSVICNNVNLKIINENDRIKKKSYF